MANLDSTTKTVAHTMNPLHYSSSNDGYAGHLEHAYHKSLSLKSNISL